MVSIVFLIILQLLLVGEFRTGSVVSAGAENLFAGAHGSLSQVTQQAQSAFDQ